MKTYAIIQSEVVIQIYFTDGDITQELHPSILAIDLTEVDPAPQVGWTVEEISGSWVFSPPVVQQPSDEILAENARTMRNQLLRSVYDPGILMAQRALRMASTPEEESYAEGKIIELDNFAEALQDIPDQIGFPQTIDWPVTPTK